LCLVVFDILLRYTETDSWNEAFFQAIPKRKQVHQSSSNGDEQSRESKHAETVDLLESNDTVCVLTPPNTAASDCTLD